MKILKLLLCLPLVTSAYNLAPENSVIFRPPLPKTGQKQMNSSYFGYEVLLYHSKATNESWIIVGAPKANYTSHAEGGNEIPAEPGVTYRCALNGKCQPLNIKNPDDEIGYIDQVGLNIVIKKEHGWFGAAMSLHETCLTICAPRVTVRIYNSLTSLYVNTMHGVCYEGDLISEDLDIEDKNFTTFDFTSEFWYNPMNGFAVHYPTPKERIENYPLRPIAGSPKRELHGTVQVIGQKRTAELPIGDDLSQFGYTLSSGYYFHEDALMVVGAAPGWQYVGQVAIMEPRTDRVSIVATVDGIEAGEYFGASLATGDINNDGLDDLIVGAPHWKNDNGRVHIFVGNRAGFFGADLFAEGRIDDGLFGYAVTCGDLDNDGFDDIIIGAPWEESGVIYVYNGDKKLTSDDEQEVAVMKPSQRIAASSISSDLLRFGFSLAKPVDLDGNGLVSVQLSPKSSKKPCSTSIASTVCRLKVVNTGHPDSFLDTAVGAYASGHAVMLLSRPIVKLDLTVSTEPATLSRNATNFKVVLCGNKHGRDHLSLRRYKITETVDADYKRVSSPVGGWIRWMDYRGRIVDVVCLNATLELKKDIRNYVDPINIVITLDPYIDDPRRNLIPIEYKGVLSYTAQTKLAFDIGCGLDDICHAFISANLEFQGIRNSTWIIGSGDLRLVLTIVNHAEPAYLATVTFEIPEGISLRSILPSCQEEMDSDTLRISCDVGNPLGINVQKRVVLNLDMSRPDASADGTELIFYVNIKTRSVNHGVKTLSVPLHPKADTSIALSGKAYDDSYYFNHNEKPSNVSLQHTYQISRFGATPISETRLIVRVPWKLGDLEYLTIFHKPRVSVLGRFHECSLSNMPVSKPRILMEKGFNENKNDKEFNFDSIVNHSRSRRSSSDDGLSKTDSISHEKRSNYSGFQSDKNTRSEFYKMSDAANVHTTHLNCSMPNVICGQIICDIPSLKSAQNVVKFQLQMVIENSKLTDDSSDREKVIHLTTEAHVDIRNSSKHALLYVPGTGLIVSVTTRFHRMPYTNNEIRNWIMMGSVLLGLLALCLVAVVLKKIGFFKRVDKEKLESLRSTEAILLDSE